MDDLRAEKYADVDREDHENRYRTEWHCERCQVSFYSWDRELLDDMGETAHIEPPCPQCLQEDEVFEGDYDIRDWA
jgi:hypothetical protein